MTDAQQRESARQFFYKWNGKGKEDEDARSYWIDILQNILGVENVTDRVEFEKKVVGGDGNTKRIDVYIPETHVLIEQKSLGIALDKPQAGHSGMTPYEQAKMYDNYLPFSERARWIVTSNFAEIWIYDRDAAKPEPVKITLMELPEKYHMLDFLVNGGLFDGDDIEIPPFTDEIMDLLLRKASDDFDWSEISQTIFGAEFESTLNPETRRSGGMHYTSIENIHKVIDPLFLDDLKAEFEEIKGISVLRTQEKKLRALQDKLASLSFLDPSAGSGNFLTESYLQLRKLENEILRLLTHGQIQFGYADMTPIKVSISQFYGIEINDFAVTVARTALWIAENQMLKETEDIVHMQLDFLPLKTNAYIVEGNALQIDWNDVVDKSKLNFIMGNPPFVGYSFQSREQKADILSVCVDEKGTPYSTAGEVDYVAGWYFRAAELMQGTKIRTAFVSTNSITQGEQVCNVWKPLFDRFGVHIDFAHRTFRWDSEASIKANVHCVIIGFSTAKSSEKKIIFQDEGATVAANINAYLLDAPDIFIDNRSKPMCNVSQMTNGNKPADGGALFLTPDERLELLAVEPAAGPYIKRVYGSVEFINNKERYCLWLKDVEPAKLRRMPHVMERVEKVRQFRLSSPKQATQKSAEYPTLFQQIRQPSETYIIVPRVSSQNRRYVPIGFMSPDIIVTNLVQFIPDAGLYEFGIITSNVHMAWMRAICGRLKSDYRYSAKIVYNNFPWPEMGVDNRKRIEGTAQAILDARSKYQNSSLTDLYDPLTMPSELRKAHTAMTARSCRHMECQSKKPMRLLA